MGSTGATACAYHFFSDYSPTMFRNFFRRLRIDPDGKISRLDNYGVSVSCLVLLDCIKINS